MYTIGSIHMDLSFLEVEGFKKADCQQTSLWSQPVTLHSGGYCTESVFEHLTSSISHHATSAHNFKTLSTKHVMRLEKVFIERELFWYCTNLSSLICEEMCIGEKGELQCSERKAFYLMILRYNSSTCKLCLNNLPILREL